jgi:ComEC/Rec2-related protein
MALGWKTALTDEVEDPFMKSGTMHVFAISGLHIALIGAIALSILRFLRIPRGLCGWLLVPMLWFYTAATGWQASAVRATVMMTIILCGWSLRRPSNLLNSLSAAALLILMIDPQQLFHASFQLSFAVVASLATVLPPLQQKLNRLVAPDPWLPRQLIPPWRRRLATPVRWLLLTTATSVAAWLGSWPLTAHYFHLLSPATLLGNVALVPCAAAALASTMASLATGAWCPWLSEVFNHGAWFWMHCMMQISEGVSEWPGAYRYVASPSTPFLAVYYGTFLVVALRPWKARGLQWILTLSFITLASLLSWQLHQHYTAITLTVLPLHGGLAIHAKPADSFHPTLIDCGNQAGFESVLQPFLQAQGDGRVRSFLLTHGDVRHMGAAEQIVDHFHPAQVGTSHVPFRSSPYRRFLARLMETKVPLRQLAPGNTVEGWEMLYPPSELKVRRADEGALVLRQNLQGSVVLLLSDLDRHGQRLLLDQAQGQRLQADIVVTGVPQRSEPLIPDLLQRVRPSLIIVGDDELPPQRRASTELLQRLRAGPAIVLSTRQTGAVRIVFHADGWTVLDASGHHLARSGPKSGPRKDLRHRGVW